VTLPGTYREIDKMPVSGSDALVAWVKHARPALERTAKTYHATSLTRSCLKRCRLSRASEPDDCSNTGSVTF
jgi:hypothetical protein